MLNFSLCAYADVLFIFVLLCIFERKELINAEHGLPQAACPGDTGAEATPNMRQPLLFGLCLDA
jgi:hypothetical protein